MPKLFGLNLVGVLAASVVFFLVGFLWYGVIFEKTWMSEAGLTAADAEGESPVWMAGGFLITILQVIGIGLVLKWRNITDLTSAAKAAGVLWLVFALPFVHYAYLYMPAHSSTMLMIDGGHLLVGWLVAAGVLTMMK